MAAAISEPILNIIVVGFHHKKGCQVEYSYPELVPGRPQELPQAWRHLPALALPDGSHNYLSDTIFFHLPSITEPAHTVYAISCFRQIPLEQVVQRTSDMTRSSVQKSVCIICRAPLFGRLSIKMELVVRAWFRQGDFSKTKLLEDAYRHLNSCPVHIDQTLEGLSATSFVEQWRHKAVLLFKLLLLQRKVVLHGSPAGPLTSSILTLISLFPDTVQYGLRESANIMLSRPMSPLTVAENLAKDVEDALEVESGDTIVINGDDNKSEENVQDASTFGLEEKERSGRQSFDETMLCDTVDKSEIITGREKCHSVGEKYKTAKTVSESQSTPVMTRDMSIDGLSNLSGQIDINECGFPIELFTEGHLCLPYLSLQYLDLLSDPAVKGFVIGASNVLFKQKRQLFDVLVELNEMRIETSDMCLKRQLQLTTEDLRFADHIVRHATSQGDAWIREQFTGYLLYLLKTSLLPDGSREIDPYNAMYMSAFKTTTGYQLWLTATNNGSSESFANIMPCHPFAGQLSVADMKLRLAHTMSSTEGGRKVTQAVMNTGRAVATTSRAVGGALSQAKGALSVWWNTLTTPSPQTELPPESETDTDVEEAKPEHPNAVLHQNDNNLSGIISVNSNLLEDVANIDIACVNEVEKITVSDAEDALEQTDVGVIKKDANKSKANDNLSIVTSNHIPDRTVDNAYNEFSDNIANKIHVI